MARAERRNRGAFLLVALGIGLMAFALVDGRSGHDAVIDTGTAPSSTSSPTVLGVVVTRDDGGPLADPATAAPLELPDPTSTTTATTRRAARAEPSSAPPPTLGTAWSIVNPNPVPPETTSTTESTSSGPESTTTTSAETTTTSTPAEG